MLPSLEQALARWLVESFELWAIAERSDQWAMTLPRSSNSTQRAPGSSGSQQRLWDFGDHVVANGGINGAGYLYPESGSPRELLACPMPRRAQAKLPPSPSNSNQSAFTTNTVHVAVTVDSVEIHVMTLYSRTVVFSNQCDESDH